MEPSPEIQERINALDYDCCVHPGELKVLPDGSVLMFSLDGSGNIHYYENLLIDRVVEVKDDTDLTNQVKFKVSKTACGISIALLNTDGQEIAEISADFFKNRLSVIAHDPSTYNGQDPTVNECLIADVRQAINSKFDET